MLEKVEGLFNNSDQTIFVFNKIARHEKMKDFNHSFEKNTLALLVDEISYLLGIGWT